MKKLKSYLQNILSYALDEKARLWLSQKLFELSDEFSEKKLYLTFSAVARFIPKNAIELIKAEEIAANELCEGWRPDTWTTQIAARALFLLQIPNDEAENYQKILHRLFDTAEVGELTALYASLPILPFAETHVAQCTEGIRTNMTVAFEAIALNNPYPARYLPENAWNQLFLKAVFTNRPIYKIQGVQQRANATLARMISDYAHERWAAGRIVTPEIWQPVARFIDHILWQDVLHLWAKENPLQKSAAALICAESNYPEAKIKLQSFPEFALQIEKGELTWESLGREWEKLQ
jgi:hypothetical protein